MSYIELIYRTIIYGGAAFGSLAVVIYISVGMYKQHKFADTVFAAIPVCFAWALIDFLLLYLLFHTFEYRIIYLIDAGQTLYFFGIIYTLYVLRFKKKTLSDVADDMKDIEDSWH